VVGRAVTRQNINRLRHVGLRRIPAANPTYSATFLDSLLVLITNNQREFERVPRLHVEDWTPWICLHTGGQLDLQWNRVSTALRCPQRWLIRHPDAGWIQYVLHMYGLCKHGQSIAHGQ